MTASEFYNKFNKQLNLDNYNWGLPNIIYSVKNRNSEDWYVLLSSKTEINKDILFYIIQDSIWSLNLLNNKKTILNLCNPISTGKLKGYEVPNAYLIKHNINIHEESIKELIEVRNTFIPVVDINDKLTGYKEEEGKLVYELDFKFIEGMAKRMAINKNKYAIYNWKKPIDIESLKQSLFRHTMAIMNNEYKDENDNYGHLFAISANTMILYYQLMNNKEELK